MEKPLKEDLEGIDDPIGLRYEDLSGMIETVFSSSLEKKEDKQHEEINSLVDKRL